MKVWKFFYTRDIRNIEHPADITDSDGQWEAVDDVFLKKNKKLSHNYPLWAYTSVKKYAKEFKKQRSKDAFIVIESDLDDTEWTYLLDNYPEQILDRYALTTKCIDKNGEVGLTEMDFICTRFENLSVTDNDMVLMEYKEYWDESLPVTCFRNKIRDALHILLYPQLRRIYYECNGYEMPDFSDEWDLPDIANDEVALLVYNFQDTFV